MGLIALIRNRAFWALDAVKGGRVRMAYNEIKRIDNLDSSDPYIKEYQKKAWKKLKKEACTFTEYYSGYEKHQFSEFPVITKNDIRSNQDSFLSGRFKKEKLIQMSTSGSTGTPFISYQNSLKKKTVNAEIVYYSEKAGYRLGENLSYIRTIVKQNKKSLLKQFLQNQTLIDCGKLSDSGMEEIIRRLQRISKKGRAVVLGYGSTYTAIKDYAIRKEIERFSGVNLKGCISGSDMLFDETREVISKVFGGIPVVSRYSNEENGVIGQDEGNNNVFTINEAGYIVEICDDVGRRLPEGTLGRIVVTDLFNYAMPMIWYDTGDMGAISVFDINGRKKRCICQFSGRRSDIIFDTGGDPLSPHIITNYMWEFTDIRQFQVIQTDEKAFSVKLNVDNQFKRQQELLAVLKSLLGEDARIHIQYVTGIPVLASGKRRYIVNEWKKQE